MTVAASGLIAAEAGAAEYVQNGGFDQATCSPAGCDAVGWSFPGANANPPATAQAIGPICNEVVTGCAISGGLPSGYTTEPNWARLGAGTGTGSDVKTVTSSLSQLVSIPAAPAMLSFNLRIMPGEATGTVFSDSYFTVKLGGNAPALGRTIFFADQLTSGYYPNYARVVIDVSSFAGQRGFLYFHGTSTYTGAVSNSFDIDDVSISESPVAPAASGPTGQRAAALKKCKKKSKKARKKCKKRALKLPV